MARLWISPVIPSPSSWQPLNGCGGFAYSGELSSAALELGAAFVRLWAPEHLPEMVEVGVGFGEYESGTVSEVGLFWRDANPATNQDFATLCERLLECFNEAVDWEALRRAWLLTHVEHREEEGE